MDFFQFIWSLFKIQKKKRKKKKDKWWSYTISMNFANICNEYQLIHFKMQKSSPESQTGEIQNLKSIWSSALGYRKFLWI